MKIQDLHNIEKIVLPSSIILALIGITEIIVGFISNSVGLQADGIGSIADSLISFIVFYGIKISIKAPDQKFHFGYYRVENLSSFVVSVIMIVSGLEIFYTAYMRILSPEKLVYPALGFIVLGITGVSCAIISFFKNRLSSRYKKLLSLKTDAKNSIKDFSTTFIIMIGVFLYYQGIPLGDSIGAMIVAVFIFWYGISIVKESSLILIDAFQNPELTDEVKKIIAKYQMVRLHGIRLRRSGPYIIGEVSLKVNPEMKVGQLLKIKEMIKKQTMSEIEGIKDLIISTE